VRKDPEVGKGHYVAIGRILGPWGLKGEVKFELYSSQSEVLFETRQVYLQAGFSFQKRSLLSVRQHGKFLRVHLEGVNSPEEAKVYQGQEVFISESELPPTQGAEYYAFELVDLEVLTTEGESLGKVKGVVHYGASDLLVVKGPEGREIQIPMIPDFLREISLDEKKIVVEGIEEFL
jgi:16S rRNA processing protein RimM